MNQLESKKFPEIRNLQVYQWTRNNQLKVVLFVNRLIVQIIIKLRKNKRNKYRSKILQITLLV
jgi:hypothetical protein